MDEQKQAASQITAEDWANTPESVKSVVNSLLSNVQFLSAQVKDLSVQVEKMSAQITKLTTENVELRSRLNQNSHNSSLPPSSDKPQASKYPTRKPKANKRGGQIGHKGHYRALLEVEKVDRIVECHPQRCQTCAKDLTEELVDLREPERRQTWELPPMKPLVTEYRLHTKNCPDCGQTNYGEIIPGEVQGAFGPRLQTIVGLLHGQGLSFGEISALMQMLFELEISKSSLVNICARLNEALAPTQAAIMEAVKAASPLYMDETGWSEEGKDQWLWVQVSKDYTVYRIESSRTQQTLQQIIGEQFNGYLISDRLGTYNLVPAKQRQICLAHLKRNFIGLNEKSKAQTKRWSRGVLRALDRLFLRWRNRRLGKLNTEQLKEALKPIKTDMRTLLDEGKKLNDPRAHQMAVRLDKLWPALWLFSEVEGVEPTNNISERALRKAVIWRKKSFGTQSSWGTQFVGRILTVLATCRQHKRDALSFLMEVLKAYLLNLPTPSLILPPSISHSVLST